MSCGLGLLSRVRGFRRGGQGVVGLVQAVVSPGCLGLASGASPLVFCFSRAVCDRGDRLSLVHSAVWAATRRHSVLLEVLR